MKRLTLVRHAEAGIVSPDFDRPLTSRGVEQARLVGESLKETRPDRIVTSTATRAVLTAQAIAQGMHLPDPDLIYDESVYEAAPSALWAACHGWDNAWEHVILVGHNPGLSMIAAELVPGALALSPSGVLDAEFDVALWQELPGPAATHVRHAPPPA